MKGNIHCLYFFYGHFIVRFNSCSLKIFFHTEEGVVRNGALWASNILGIPWSWNMCAVTNSHGFHKDF